MSETIDIGVIGLGVMGQRMLARLAEHAQLRALVAWDPSTVAVAQVRAQYPKLNIAASAEALVASDRLRCMYVASPPASHLEHANRGFDAALAVFCEKPLTVDFAAARATIARIESEKRLAAVNFSLASSPGLATMASAVKDGSIGKLERLEIEVAFEQWPRAWQAAAGRWLGERTEGGFTREVLSHFVFIVQRALGRIKVLGSKPEYPADGRSAERALEARLDAGGLPVTVTGRVGGNVADFNRMTLVGTEGAIEIHDWFGLRHRKGRGEWRPVRTPQENRQIGQRGQLDQLTAMIEKRPHKLPSFAEALAVQETIETLLQGR
jgi:predicted dehydrogenase